MLWRTTGETGWRVWLGPAATVAAVCLLLALSFALQYGLAAAAAHQSDGRYARSASQRGQSQMPGRTAA